MNFLTYLFLLGGAFHLNKKFYNIIKLKIKNPILVEKINPWIWNSNPTYRKEGIGKILIPSIIITKAIGNLITSEVVRKTNPKVDLEDEPLN